MLQTRALLLCLLPQSTFTSMPPGVGITFQRGQTSDSGCGCEAGDGRTHQESRSGQGTQSTYFNDSEQGPD